MASSAKPHSLRRAFLRALSQCGNVSLAAKAVGICSSPLYRLRKRNPHFAELWSNALERGRAAVADGKVPDLLSVSSERKLVVRGSKNGNTKVVCATEGQWDEDKEARFLAHLAATANVTASARAANISTVAVYLRRQQWPAFAAAWDEAKAYAVDRLDFYLIEAATNLFDPPEVPHPEPVPVSFDQAFKLVQHAQTTNKRGETKRHGWNRKPVDMDALGEELLRKLAVIRKHDAG